MKIFVAAPLTGKISRRDGLVIPEFRQELTSLYQFLRNKGHSVISAHEREAWGARLMPAEVCTPLDFAGIEESDFLLAIPENSFGVHVELGYAAAWRKPVLQLRREGENYTPLLDGLSRRTSSISLSFMQSVIEVFPDLPEAFSALLKSKPGGY